METVKSKDRTVIAYQRSGEGPPFVLVHGTTADHTRWPHVLPAHVAMTTAPELFLREVIEFLTA